MMQPTPSPVAPRAIDAVRRNSRARWAVGCAVLAAGLVAAAVEARPTDVLLASVGLDTVAARADAAQRPATSHAQADIDQHIDAADDAIDEVADDADDHGGTAVAQIDRRAPPAHPHAAARAAPPRWQWQRLLETEVETLRDRTLSRERPYAQTEAQALLRLRVQHRPRDGWRLVGETELVGSLERERGEPSERGAAVRINQAYAAWDRPAFGARETEWRLGRWLLRDEREWLFDENFDGLLVDIEHDDWQAHALAARVNLLPRGAFDANRRGGRDVTTGALLRHEWRRDWTLGGYLLRRDDREPQGERFTLLGLRSHGQPRRGRPLQHWLELGAAVGRAADGRRIEGWAFDVGGVYHADALPGRPRFIVGHAQASGDRGADNDSARDGRYRPTGLQSYEGALGSRIKRKLYGEVLDPDLSNLRIDTLGVGLTLSERVTLDLVMHRYAQRTIARLRDTGLRPARDDLGSRHLGSGVDLLLGARLGREVQLEAVLAWFRPDQRFQPLAPSPGESGSAPTAVHARVTLEWQF